MVTPPKKEEFELNLRISKQFDDVTHNYRIGQNPFSDIRSGFIKLSRQEAVKMLDEIEQIVEKYASNEPTYEPVTSTPSIVE